MVLACLLCAAVAQAADEDESCLKCHANKAELAKALGGKERPLEPLLIDPAKWAKDHHNSKGCANCHFDYDSTPHPGDAETIQCAECHEDAAKVYAASVHAKAEKSASRRSTRSTSTRRAGNATSGTETGTPAGPSSRASATWRTRTGTESS